MQVSSLQNALCILYSHMGLNRYSTTNFSILSTLIYLYGFPSAFFFSGDLTLSNQWIFTFPLSEHGHICEKNYKYNYIIFHTFMFLSLFFCLGKRWWGKGLVSHVFSLPSKDTRTVNSLFFNDQGLRLIFISDSVWVVQFALLIGMKFSKLS